MDTQDKQPTRIEWRWQGDEYSTKLPTNGNVQQASRIAAIVFSQCIRDDIMTRDEICKIMTAKGLMSSDDGNLLDDYSNTINEKIIAMSDPEIDKEARAQFAREIREIREKRFELHAKAESFYGYSAEALSDEARHGYLTAACTFKIERDDKGDILAEKLYWEKNGSPSLEAYKADDDVRLCAEALNNALTLMHGLTPEMLNKRMEDIFMGIIDSADSGETLDPQIPETDDTPVDDLGIESYVSSALLGDGQVTKDAGNEGEGS